MLAAITIVFLVATLVVQALANDLPPALRIEPHVTDYDWSSRVSGLVFDREALSRKPRVVFGYLSDQDWAFMEFLCFLHASWHYVASLAEPTGYRIDLLVFAAPRWRPQLAALCPTLPTLDLLAASDFGRLRTAPRSSCWTVLYPPPYDPVWQGYPFVASYHYLGDLRVARMLTSVYGYAMKTDFDCFLTPAFIQHFPQQLEVGNMSYTLLPGTSQRLRLAAARLGLTHRGLHDIGPTWYGAVHAVVALANASLPLVYHLLDREFGEVEGPRRADGSWPRNWMSGEGWPLWSRDMAVMYGTDLALNHLFDNYAVSNKYDVRGDSPRLTFSLFHIHSQHGDREFSKFEFFQHKYHHIDLASPDRDFHRVRDYAISLSATTWRRLVELQGRQPQEQQGLRQPQEQGQQERQGPWHGEQQGQQRQSHRQSQQRQEQGQQEQNQQAQKKSDLLNRPSKEQQVEEQRRFESAGDGHGPGALESPSHLPLDRDL